jgi:hypothetical protein
MSNDETLISKLISETYSESAEKDLSNEVSDLRNYFEKKLNEVDFCSISEYMVQHKLSLSDLIFQSQTRCYRLINNKAVLDFPSNWSVFREIQNEKIIFLDQSLDQDNLLDIFSELNGQYFNVAILKYDSEIKLVYLPEEESKNHLKWFRSYFEKKQIEESLNSAA